MLQTRLARQEVYRRIHQWLNSKAYREHTKLNDIINDGRKWDCNLKEYLTIYPEDKGL